MNDRSIAYFSMEIALEEGIPTYSGGLGVLAGDTIRSAADLKVPVVAVTLIHRKGYFLQHLDAAGRQTEEPVEWTVEDVLEEMPARASVIIEDRTVHLRAWRHEITGAGGFKVPVYLLDTDLPENAAWDRELTHFLYGGDQHYRFCQEVVLGIGGLRMLRALGYEDIRRFHMNEGHAAFLTLELLYEEAQKAGRQSISSDDIEYVRKKCVFTTHTPVPAGHDQFPMDLFDRVFIHRKEFLDMKEVFCIDLANHITKQHMDISEMAPVFMGGSNINMTYLALNLSHYVNGVAKKHGEVSSLMFSAYKIDAITNGVHAANWVSGPFQELYDRHIPGWRQDNFTLRYALSIAAEEIWQAHMRAKDEMLRHVNNETGAGMDSDVLTVCFARRAASYKRLDLLFTDIERLRHIASRVGPFQVIYAGKAHPQDMGGKETIQRIFRAMESLKNDIRITYLANYNLRLAKMLTAGSDLWLNTPQPPMEASGTSGMKAALNGVPSLSILDGWWIEGCIEGITGWSIGENARTKAQESDWSKDAGSLYEKLEHVIIPMFYNERNRFINIMRHAIALNGSFFNTQRMMQQYVLNAYFL
ncbi:MAG: alpha-glucan family phosphorylase [Deferribacteres bacterium]|nr:alpha-glucan family phosphorylase [Deferribacteres bacterium]